MKTLLRDERRIEVDLCPRLLSLSPLHSFLRLWVEKILHVWTSQLSIVPPLPPSALPHAFLSVGLVSCPPSICSNNSYLPDLRAGFLFLFSVSSPVSPLLYLYVCTRVILSLLFTCVFNSLHNRPTGFPCTVSLYFSLTFFVRIFFRIISIPCLLFNYTRLLFSRGQGITSASTASVYTGSGSVATSLGRTLEIHELRPTELT